jgi:hypothetical protein
MQQQNRVDLLDMRAYRVTQRIPHDQRVTAVPVGS